MSKTLTLLLSFYMTSLINSLSLINGLKKFTVFDFKLMTLSPEEQTKFRAYVAHRLCLEVERLIPEYIHTHHHLQDDIEDKGIEIVTEAFETDVANLSFNWN